MKKKFNTIISAVCVFVCAVVLCLSAGCTKTEKKSLNVVVTVFPEYDWVINVLGEHSQDVGVTLLLDNGVELHSYEPTAKDIIAVSSCDLFIYVGGESDSWVDNVLKSSANKNMRTINLIKSLGERAKEEELIEGMEVEPSEDAEYDEHVWLSLGNARAFVTEIAEELGKIDVNNAADYLSNAQNYNQKLSALDQEYEKAALDGNKDTLVFADRFPFRYLLDDYGLKYYAAFSGCSAEVNASFATVAFLAEKVDELELDYILKIESSDGSLATAVKNATKNKNQKILTLDSLQSGTIRQFNAGRTYLSVMSENLNVLKTAIA